MFKAGGELVKGCGMEHIIGIRIINLDEVDSTNEYAKRIAPSSPEGTVVVAGKQTLGKGRRGRKWASPEGGLWMSVVLKPEVDAADMPKIVFIGALAVVDTLQEFGIRAGIKWPNDVWVDGRKICGILTEGKLGKFVVLGIGLNVNNEIPEELKEMATSMKLILGREVDLGRVLKILLRNLDRWYRGFLKDGSSVISAVKERCFVLGRRVRVVEDGGELIGQAVDIDESGALILETSKGSVRLFYGDVSLRF